MAQVLANGATTLPPSNPLFSPEPNLTLPKKSRKINVSNIGRKVRTYIQTWLRSSAQTVFILKWFA